MNKFFRLLARKFFAKWIKVYWNEVVISDEELLYSKGKAEFYVKDQIAKRFAEQLMKDGRIEFESNKDYSRMTTTIRGKLRVI